MIIPARDYSRSELKVAFDMSGSVGFGVGESAVMLATEQGAWQRRPGQTSRSVTGHRNLYRSESTIHLISELIT